MKLETELIKTLRAVADHDMGVLAAFEHLSGLFSEEYGELRSEYDKLYLESLKLPD